MMESHLIWRPKTHSHSVLAGLSKGSSSSPNPQPPGTEKVSQQHHLLGPTPSCTTDIIRILIFNPMLINDLTPTLTQQIHIGSQIGMRKRVSKSLGQDFLVCNNIKWNQPWRRKENSAFHCLSVSFKYSSRAVPFRMHCNRPIGKWLTHEWVSMVKW